MRQTREERRAAQKAEYAENLRMAEEALTRQTKPVPPRPDLSLWKRTNMFWGVFDKGA